MDHLGKDIFELCSLNVKGYKEISMDSFSTKFLNY